MSNENDTIEPQFACAADKLKALSHPLRLSLLTVLQDCEMAVNEVVALTGVNQSTVSRHLTQLREAGFISARRDANRILYKVQDDKIVVMLRLLNDVFLPPGRAA